MLWLKYQKDESCGLGWHLRYGIIRGVCCGLHYLHTECHIVHLDLKPENILLDDNMMPKITDFGMSRLFGQQQTRIITESRGGSLGYMAPEYLTSGLITTKSDIYSLGVIIIELMTGCRDYRQSSRTSSEHFVDNVTGKWRERLGKALRHTTLEIYSQQVNICIMLGLTCVDPDPKKRPAAWDIIQMLNQVEDANRCFGEKEGIENQELQMVTHTSSRTIESSFSAMVFNRMLSSASTSRITNISTMFSSATKGRNISIMAFEVANTIVKGSYLMKSLSEQSMRDRKKGVLRSQLMLSLTSEDHSQLLALVEADIREELREFCKAIARFGDWCIDPRWKGLERYLFSFSSMFESELKPRRDSKEAAVSSMQYLVKLAEGTSELYPELLKLDKMEEDYLTLRQDKTTDSWKNQRIVIKNQLSVVMKLKRKTLWCHKMENILEKPVQVVHFMHLEINNTFLKNHKDQPVNAEINLKGALGLLSGHELHCANVILKINSMALALSGEPSCINFSLSQQPRPHMESVQDIIAEMNRILSWLVPAAESTRLYLMNGAYSEWATRRSDYFDDEVVDGSSILIRHSNAKLISKLETLHYADKAKTEAYIIYLSQLLRDVGMVKPRRRLAAAGCVNPPPLVVVASQSGQHAWR